MYAKGSRSWLSASQHGEIHLAAHTYWPVFPFKRKEKETHGNTPTDSPALLRRAQGDFLLRQLSVFYEGTHVGSAAVCLMKRELISSHTVIPAIGRATASRSSSCRQPKVWRGWRRLAEFSSGLTGLMRVFFFFNCNLTLSGERNLSFNCVQCGLSGENFGLCYSFIMRFGIRCHCVNFPVVKIAHEAAWFCRMTLNEAGRSGSKQKATEEWTERGL